MLEGQSVLVCLTIAVGAEEGWRRWGHFCLLKWPANDIYWFKGHRTTLGHFETQRTHLKIFKEEGKINKAAAFLSFILNFRCKIYRTAAFQKVSNMCDCFAQTWIPMITINAELRCNNGTGSYLQLKNNALEIIYNLKNSSSFRLPWEGLHINESIRNL